jgi:hypothetical protein
LDNIVYLWDVTRVKTSPAPKEPPTEKDLASWWEDLAGDDTGKAGAALSSMLQGPEQSVAFLKKRLQPAKIIDDKDLAKLIADLDSENFDDRQAASRRLTELHERAEAALKGALKDSSSLELTRRLRELLDRLEIPMPASPTLRQLRAIEVLENLATPAAWDCIRVMADGAPEAYETRAAKAALKRRDADAQRR